MKIKGCWWMKTITEEMSNYSSWLGDFSWSEIGDVSNQKYVHLSFQFINYWMSSILQFMVWFSDKSKHTRTKKNWFKFHAMTFYNWFQCLQTYFQKCYTSQFFVLQKIYCNKKNNTLGRARYNAPKVKLFMK